MRLASVPGSALLLAAVLAAPALAQTAIRPADPAFDAARIVPGVRRSTIRLLAPMQQDIGTITETTTVAGDRITSVTRLAVSMGNQAQTDSLVATWPGLAPVFASTVRSGAGGARTESATFAGTTAATRVVASGTTTDSTRTLAEPVFSSGWTGEIVRMLPLAPDYRGTFTVLDAGDGLVPMTATVTGSETVSTPAGPVEAWTVDTVRPDQTMTYVVAKDTGALLARRFAPQPGALVEIVPAP